MKRKLIVTLVASALELYAATAGAQVGSCDIQGNNTSANAATAVRTGPLNPVDGFPEYVTDSNRVSVQRCLDPVVCFFDPIVPSDPYSLQIGSGGEAFYWSADTSVSDVAGNRILTLGMAAETAFLENGPNGEPVDGSQFPFLRLRFVMGVPVDGTYTVKHPYGADVFTVTGATGARDVFQTVDSGFAPNSTLVGTVGPFLVSDSAPRGFLGDANGAADLVTGSPCGRNFVEVSGVDTAGFPVNFGTSLNPQTVLTTDNFVVQGQIYDQKVQTPLAPTRLTYSRTAAGAGQIDTFATSTATATLTVTDGPTIPADTIRIGAAKTLDRTAISATEGQDSLSVFVNDPSALPPIVTLKATDAVSDDTTLNLHLVDFVDIAQADYDPATGILSVTATSSDLRAKPSLTLRDFGDFTPNESVKQIALAAPPAVVFVDSAAGGSASAQVRMIQAAPPAAPTALVLGSASATSVTLNWTDNAGNESGFKVYTIDASGVRSQVALLAANTRTVTLRGLTALTAYTFQVDAYNAAGATRSNTLDASTLALPVAPSGVAAALGGVASRAINVSWTDNSGDETGFVISRSTTANGVYTQVGTAGQNATSYTDVGGTSAPANGATYFYRVVAVRDGETSAFAQGAQSVTTPTSPTSPALLSNTTTPRGTAFTAVGTNAITVNWSDRANNEASYQVYRRNGTTGAFTAVSGLLAGNAAGTAGVAMSYTDTTVLPGTQYSYRVDVANWTGAVQSAVSVGVTTAEVLNLQAPTNLAASAALRPVLSWTDASTGESGYRVSRTPITVNANGSITAGATTNVPSTILANAVTFTDTTNQTNTVRYNVSALSGTTVGAAAQVYTAIGGLPTPTLQTQGLSRTLVGVGANATARVTVTLPGLNTATVGGYEIQRCVAAGATGVQATTCAAGTSFEKVIGTAVNTAGTVDGRATTSFQDNTVARATNYAYRIRTVGGAGTGLLSGFSAVRAVSTN